MVSIILTAFRIRLTGQDRDRGSVTLEAAIIVPVAVVVTFLVVQFVLVWHGRHVAQAAAQSAARAAASYHSNDAAGQAAGDRYLAEVAPTLLPGRTVSITRDGAAATAVVHSQVLTVVPFLSFDVEERATVPLEEFTPAAGP